MVMTSSHVHEDDKSDDDVATVQSSGSISRGRNRRRVPEFTAVVMAAGYGSQMFELSGCMPKCMIPLANTPMIWFPIHFLIRHKFEDAIIVVREGAKEQIEKYLTSQLRAQSLELHLEFVCIDDESDMGTADSLRLLAPKTKSDLLVISSDLVTNVSLHEQANVHRANNAALTALVAPRYIQPTADGRKKRNKKDDRDFTGLDPADGRMLFISSEKDIEEEISLKRGQLAKFPHMRLYTNLLDSHLYLVSRSVLNLLENHSSVSMMRCELLPLLVRKQIKQLVNEDSRLTDRLYSTKPCNEEDVKTPDEFYEALCDPENVGCFALQSKEFTIRMNQLHNYIKYNRAVSEHMADMIPNNDETTCEIHKMTQVGKCSRIGNNVKIAEKCGFKRSFIGNNVQIGAHCKIVDCVIMNDVRIEDNISLTNCIVCNDATIRSQSTLKDCRVCAGFEVSQGSEIAGESLDVAGQNMMSFSLCASGASSDADGSESNISM